ncbi:MAG: PPOX class F420-dependent oxidoreductase [Pseudomonadales bacterium]
MPTTPTAASLARASYVSLATFRKSGAQVATPVWCAADGDDFYFFSAAGAGKVKRLRNSDRARLAVCDVRGKLSSDWIDASAIVLRDDAEIERALGALRRKYGWQMWLADMGARLTGKFDKRAYIRARLSAASR